LRGAAGGRVRLFGVFAPLAAILVGLLILGGSNRAICLDPIPVVLLYRLHAVSGRHKVSGQHGMLARPTRSGKVFRGSSSKGSVGRGNACRPAARSASMERVITSDLAMTALHIGTVPARPRIFNLLREC
jgi:hypothetical protein